jgi:predicted HD superfamily hydrolase involved in NAD metabolism
MEERTERADLIQAADALACERLSRSRYAHTIRVADTAERLAAVHGLDRRRTRLAALLHDAARELPAEEYLRLAEEWGLPVDGPERKSPKLLHGPVAAALARTELGIEDEEVLDAVRVHTVGRPGMRLLALALYVADKIEPDRGYPSVDRLRKLAEQDLHEAAREALQRSRAYNEQRGRPTHPASLKTLEWLEETVNERVDQRDGDPHEDQRDQGREKLDQSPALEASRKESEGTSQRPEQRHTAGVQRVGDEVRGIPGPERVEDVRVISQEQPHGQHKERHPQYRMGQGPVADGPDEQKRRCPERPAKGPDHQVQDGAL